MFEGLFCMSLDRLYTLYLAPKQALNWIPLHSSFGKPTLIMSAHFSATITAGA
jgi:hypothetical protein